MTTEVAIETTKIQSVCGLLYDLRRWADYGRDDPSPGNVSFAHNGVLSLDAFPEFKRSTTRGLAAVEADRKVPVSRAVGR